MVTNLKKFSCLINIDMLFSQNKIKIKLGLI
jgi:hypothetical protein